MTNLLLERISQLNFSCHVAEVYNAPLVWTILWKFRNVPETQPGPIAFLTLCFSSYTLRSGSFCSSYIIVYGQIAWVQESRNLLSKAQCRFRSNTSKLEHLENLKLNILVCPCRNLVAVICDLEKSLAADMAH